MSVTSSTLTDSTMCFPPTKKKQDVLRNECFKREQPVGEALRGLYRDEGLAFLHRYVC